MDKIITKIKTETTEVFHLDRQDLIDVMQKFYKLNSQWRTLNIQFKIPSGGDYSGETLDIDKTNPIIITATYIDEK